MDEMTFTLHNPLTEEEWDIIEDVDFEHTNSITFHTKNGKEVEFVKCKTGRWLLHTYMPHKNYCSNCEKDSPYNIRWHYCPNCGADMRGEQE